MEKLILFFISALIVNYSYCQTAHWAALPNAPYGSSGTRFEDVYFINENTGWIVNYSGKVFRTVNGGNSWDTTFISNGGSFRSIGFFDSQTGLLGTLNVDSNLVLFRTTNGGSNFTALTNLPFPRILGTCAINIVNENVAFACGRWDSPARIIKTTDKGISWTSFFIDTLIAKSLVDCYFFNADSGIVVGGTNPNSNGNAVVLKTNDGGNTWQQVYRTARAGEFCWKIYFVNRNLGYASIQGPSSYYLKSTNGGVSWSEELFRSYTQQGIGFLNENTGWIGGWGGPNYETTDAGVSWHLAGWGNFVNRFRFLNDTLAYAVGAKVYKYSKESVGVQLTGSEIPKQFSLEQNYPNPFNPVTIINYSLSVTRFISIKVYDVLGNEVATLVNGKQNAGSYEVEFDGSKLSSGIYFYKLEAGDFSQVRKMTLVK